MGHLKDKEREQLAKVLEKLQNEVKLLMFTQEMECQYCQTTREMLEDVAGLSEKIKLEIHDFVAEAELAKQLGVDKVPAIVVQGDQDYGIRFYGIPGGYEFSTLIEDIQDVSSRDPRLPGEVLAELAKVDQPVHMQVMISPT